VCVDREREKEREGDKERSGATITFYTYNI
jgi:hypothetical protein